MTAVTATNEDEKLLRTYVGANADYYLRKWACFHEVDLKGTGFNWSAFFFAGFWLFYRKMYATATILFGLIFVEFLVEELLLQRFLSKSEFFAFLDLIIAIVVSIFVGCLGNYLYYRKASQMVSKAKSAYPTEEAQIQFLSKRGGRSVVTALAGVGLIVAVVFGLSFFLPTYQYGQRIDFGSNCEVYYSGEATKADAQRLGAILTEEGYFEASEAASVRIERARGQGLTISFVVIEGAWNDLDNLRFFEQLGRTIADAGLGRPLTISLCNEYFEMQESLFVE
jgi:hypothetical protein